MKTNANKYLAYLYVFLFLFAVFLLGEFICKLIFYPEIPYWKSIVLVALAAGVMAFIIFKRGEVNSLSDIVKYKKKKLKLNQELNNHSKGLIKQTLTLNRYVVNEKKSNENNIYFSSKFHFLDFGDVFHLNFSNNEVTIKTRPKAIVNITDPNRITAKRMGQVEQIIHYITQNANIKK